MSTVSVIIPAFNAASTIGAAIESVLSQSHPADEVLVVDDGSTDNSVKVASRYGRFVDIIRTPNGGPSHARNEGLMRARGDWVAFLDADDRWHPDKLKVQLRVAMSSPGTQVVAADWRRGADFRPVPATPRTLQVSYDNLLAMNQFQTSTVLMVRSLTLQLRGFDSSMNGAEDWDFWLRAVRQANILKVDWPLVQYRDVSGGYSKDLARSYDALQRMWKKHTQNSDIPPFRYARLETWHHIRFWLAFTLQKDQKHARLAWNMTWQSRLRRHVPYAATKYLLPYLTRRFLERRKRRTNPHGRHGQPTENSTLRRSKT